MDDAKTKEEFTNSIVGWLTEGWKSSCHKRLDSITDVPPSAYEMIENKTEQTDYSYCRGNRAEASKRFTNGSKQMPSLLYLNIEKVTDVEVIPSSFLVGKKWEYKLLGITYQKKRGSHYGAFLHVEEKKFHFDAIAKPTISKFNSENNSNIILQNCIYVFVEC